MEKEIVIDYNPNVDELLKATYYTKFKNWKIRLIIIIGFIVLILNLVIEPLKKSNKNILDFFPLIFIIFLFFIGRYRHIQKTKNLYFNDSKFKENKQIILNKEKLDYIGETFNIKYSWNEFSKIEETDKWLLLYLGSNRVFPIIKSDLKDNQYNDLKVLFNSIAVKKKLL
jgi:hypothetical protein